MDIIKRILLICKVLIPLISVIIAAWSVFIAYKASKMTFRPYVCIRKFDISGDNNKINAKAEIYNTGKVAANELNTVIENTTDKKMEKPITTTILFPETSIFASFSIEGGYVQKVLKKEIKWTVKITINYKGLDKKNYTSWCVYEFNPNTKNFNSLKGFAN